MYSGLLNYWSRLKKRPFFELFKLAIKIAIFKIVWTFAGLQLNPLNPDNPFFNPKYFRFSNYESDPIGREAIARKVFPKGMAEDDVDEILITDLFVGKGYGRNEPIKGHVYYIYNTAPWRMLRHVHSVIYDDNHKLVDVFPGNGRGIYSGLQLEEIREKGGVLQ